MRLEVSPVAVSDSLHALLWPLARAWVAWSLVTATLIDEGVLLSLHAHAITTFPGAWLACTHRHTVDAQIVRASHACAHSASDCSNTHGCVKLRVQKVSSVALCWRGSRGFVGTAVLLSPERAGSRNWCCAAVTPSPSVQQLHALAM